MERGQEALKNRTTKPMLCGHILPHPHRHHPHTVFSRRRREGGHPRESGLSPVWVRVGLSLNSGFHAGPTGDDGTDHNIQLWEPVFGDSSDLRGSLSGNSQM